MIDALSRRIVGGLISSSLRSDRAREALEMAICIRREDGPSPPGPHSDRGVQPLDPPKRATRRGGCGRLVGSRGDSYDNALAGTVDGLHTTELIRRHGPWRTIELVELATLACVDWWNRRRLHSACNDSPPAAIEPARHPAAGRTGHVNQSRGVSTKASRFSSRK